MLDELKLKNFRCFKDFTIEFSKFNIIVGKNNIGKSTIIDALKLVSNAGRYSPYRKFFYLEREDANVCYLEERDIPFSQVNLRYNYTSEDIIIYSKFSDNTEIKIVFPFNDTPYACFKKDGINVAAKDSLRNYFQHSLGIIPPVGTFEESEELGDRKYILSIVVSHLTPRHFRNIWYYFKEGFEEFRRISKNNQ